MSATDWVHFTETLSRPVQDIGVRDVMICFEWLDKHIHVPLFSQQIAQHLFNVGDICLIWRGTLASNASDFTGFPNTWTYFSHLQKWSPR